MNPCLGIRHPNCYFASKNPAEGVLAIFKVNKHPIEFGALVLQFWALELEHWVGLGHELVLQGSLPTLAGDKKVYWKRFRRGAERTLRVLRGLEQRGLLRLGWKAPKIWVEPSDDLLELEGWEFKQKLQAILRRLKPSLLKELIIPGKGERGKNCGLIAPLRECLRCGTIEFGPDRCYQSSCPSCWGLWRDQLGKRILRKLEAKRRMLASRGKHPKFHHVVVSPPPEIEFRVKLPEELRELERWDELEQWMRAKFLDRLFEKAKEIFKQAGALEGVGCFHPFRLRGISEFDLEGEQRKWKEVRRRPDWRDWVELSPHFHGFVLSEWVGSGAGIWKRTGWVLKRITKPGSKVSLGNLEDLARSVLYCLSHLGVMEGKKTIRWFGDIAGFKPRMAEEEVLEAMKEALQQLGFSSKVIAEPKRCPKCGGKLVPFRGERKRVGERKRIVKFGNEFWGEQLRSEYKLKVGKPPPKT
jgi:hypothetical protein